MKNLRIFQLAAWLYLAGIIFSFPSVGDNINALAIAGDVNAQYELGRRLERGDGMARNDDQALYWFKQAAEQGHGIAQFNLGWMYANGYGGTKDNIQAYIWFFKATEQKVADALGQLTVLSRSMSAEELSIARQSLGEKNNYKDTAKSLNLSLNETEAFLELRIRYNHGDSKNALSVLGDMALAGNMDAQNLLGFHLMNSKNEIERLEAFKWLFRAAKQGDAAARYNLAVCFLKGIGTKVAPVKAIRWLNLATETLGPQRVLDYAETTRLFQEKSEYSDAYIAASQGYESAEWELRELIKLRLDESFARLELLKSHSLNLSSGE